MSANKFRGYDERQLQNTADHLAQTVIRNVQALKLTTERQYWRQLWQLARSHGDFAELVVAYPNLIKRLRENFERFMKG